MVQSRAAHWGARAGVATLATAATLIGAEIAARRYYAGTDARLTARDVAAEADDVDRDHLRLGDIVQPAPWEDVIFELKPDYSGTYLDCAYRTNAHGMRDKDLRVAKPEGGYRIALLGDSFAFGWGVEVHLGFADRLEALLGQYLGRPVEVLNFGVPGYNTAIEAACLERRALAFEPDLVLVQFYKNDYHLPNFLLEPVPTPRSYVVRFIQDRLAMGRAPLLRRSNEGKDQAALLDEAAMDPERVPPEVAYMVGVSGVERALTRIRDLAAARGIPVVFLDLQFPMQRMLTLTDAELEVFLDHDAIAVATALGIPVIRSLFGMRDAMTAMGVGTDEVILSQSDWHLNTLGHRLMAEVIAHALTTTGVLPSRGP